MIQMTSKIREHMDTQTIRAIMLSIIARYEKIQSLYGADAPEIYPGEIQTRTQERQAALTDVIHLTHEMGWDFEELINF